MANPPPSKHVVYFEVLEALQDQGCPVCRLGLRAVSRYLDALSYEGINDPGSRAELRAARGFCHWHAWQFVEEVRDGLGTAIIYRDVIGEVLRILPEVGACGARRQAAARSPLRTKHRSLVALASRLAPQRECPACHCLAESSRRYLDTLLDHLRDGGFRNQYLASDGLCLPHLVIGLRRASTGRQRDFLAQAFARRLAPSGAGLAPGPSLDGIAIVEAMVGKEGATQLGRPANPPTGRTGGVLGREALGSEHDADEEGCPVCRSVAPAIDRWLAQAADESAAADAQQSNSSPAASLCNAHLWRLLHVAGTRGTAGFLQPQALAVADLLQPQARQADYSVGWRWLLAPLRPLKRGEAAAGVTATIERGRCPACEAQAAMERQATLAVFKAMQHNPGAAELRAAPQLCLPHFALALSMSGDWEQAEILAAGQVEALEALRWDLAEYIRKQDYRFRHEPLGTEVDAPWRAIAQVAGAQRP